MVCPTRVRPKPGEVQPDDFDDERKPCTMPSPGDVLRPKSRGPGAGVEVGNPASARPPDGAGVEKASATQGGPHAFRSSDVNGRHGNPGLGMAPANLSDDSAGTGQNVGVGVLRGATRGEHQECQERKPGDDCVTHVNLVDSSAFERVPGCLANRGPKNPRQDIAAPAPSPRRQWSAQSPGRAVPHWPVSCRRRRPATH